MEKTLNRISSLRKSKNLPHYAEGLFKGIEKAIRENREIEIGGNSILFINRMFENRFERRDEKDYNKSQLVPDMYS